MGLAFEKPKRGTHKLPRRRRRLLKSQNKQAVRAELFPIGQVVTCLCCKRRPATSMHEIKFESTGGVASRVNSVAVCGTGTTGCHGHLQEHRIRAQYVFHQWVFTPTRDVARRWMSGDDE